MNMPDNDSGPHNPGESEGWNGTETEVVKAAETELVEACKLSSALRTLCTRSKNISLRNAARLYYASRLIPHFSYSPLADWRKLHIAISSWIVPLISPNAASFRDIYLIVSRGRCLYVSDSYRAHPCPFGIALEKWSRSKQCLLIISSCSTYSNTKSIVDIK